MRRSNWIAHDRTARAAASLGEIVATETVPADASADETGWSDAVVDLKNMAAVIRRSWSKLAKVGLLAPAGDGGAPDQRGETPSGFANVTLCSIIAGVVDRIDDLESVQMALRELRRMQAERGCRVLDVPAGRLALMAALRQVLGGQCTAETEAAWMHLYDLIAAALDVATPAVPQDDRSTEKRSG